MRNGIRYILILCLFFGSISCQKDSLLPPGKGKGRLVLKDVEISIEASTEVITRTPSTFTAPAASELTYRVTDTQTGETVYDRTGEFTSLVLDEGSYRLEASYGTETMGTTPYLYAATEEFQIVKTTEIVRSLSVKLSCAIVHPAITDKLLEQYSTYKIEVSDGTTTQEITNNTDFFVPAGKDYTLTLSGTNALNEAQSNSWELKGVLAANRYTLNCNPDLPSFTLPEQAEGDVWSTFIYITPMTAADMSSKPEMTEKVLGNIVYEASSDGTNWIQAVHDNGKTVIKELTPGSRYTVRSRFGAVTCSNAQIVTTEQARQLENGDMETWEKVEFAKAYDDYFYDYFLGSQSNHIWETNNTESLNGATTHATSNIGTYWRWCAGTQSTSDVSAIDTDIQSASAAEISTLAFYNDKITGWYVGTISSNKIISNWLSSSHRECIGLLYTDMTPITSRPLSISFDCKYTPITGDYAPITISIYDNNKNKIATDISHNITTEISEYTKVTLKINYTDLQRKIAYISIRFQSGVNTNYTLMHVSQGSYNSSPRVRDRVVGSVLKIDNVVLNYDYE